MTDKERHQQRKEYILSKKKVPCHDCGGTFPEVCMDFHHEDEESKDRLLKQKNGSMIVRMQTWGINRIDEELSKCVVLCSNCHRIRHHYTSH